uniref:Uncharacterized protein n=1 Tax=Arundo donax TaxID=35708 RepID=A0A0A8YS38_ARUDO
MEPSGIECLTEWSAHSSSIGETQVRSRGRANFRVFQRKKSPSLCSLPWVAACVRHC